MTDTTQDQTVLEFAQAEIAAGKTVQQIADDIQTYFNKTFTTQQITDYLAAHNLQAKASNPLLWVGLGLLAYMVFRGKK